MDTTNARGKAAVGGTKIFHFAGSNATVRRCSCSTVGDDFREQGHSKGKCRGRQSAAVGSICSFFRLVTNAERTVVRCSGPSDTYQCCTSCTPGHVVHGEKVGPFSMGHLSSSCKTSSRILAV
ncbi:unnamed protein product [Chondrus crispus]|uniref:Uncharacterized protein n=1 Tax=Chondrus crispus TaxID=2769 RepID=R7QL78_CHOCR|nr:unnamed protein product [Chondrus crispus]CDF38145.1 unnamed protein product [Chondrus crispus]|eukprot:XP_005718014.1 unnamed protein product [Chondrus crispus]